MTGGFVIMKAARVAHPCTLNLCMVLICTGVKSTFQDVPGRGLRLIDGSHVPAERASFLLRAILSSLDRACARTATRTTRACWVPSPSQFGSSPR